MWVLRLLAVLLLISVAGCMLVYVLTGQKRYKTLAWRLVRYGLFIAFCLLALLLIERLAVLML